MNWKLHLPREKQGVVDKNEEVDEVLFQAHNLLQLCVFLFCSFFFFPCVGLTMLF